jgi:hypothetical protein
MWFYLYLLTASFYDKMGFYIWGYTTDIDFSYQKMFQYTSSQYPDIYYHAVYRMPTKYVAFPFDRIISPPHYHMVRDGFGLEWYKISDSHLEYIFSNASIPAEKIKIKWNKTFVSGNNSDKRNSTNSYNNSNWTHTEL